MFFVHRYKDSHRALRKKWRKRVKDGKAVIIRQDDSGWYYKLIKEISCNNSQENSTSKLI